MGLGTRFTVAPPVTLRLVLTNWALRSIGSEPPPARLKALALGRKKTPAMWVVAPPDMLWLLPPASVHRARSSNGLVVASSSAPGRRPVISLGADQSREDPLPMFTTPGAFHVLHAHGRVPLVAGTLS